MTEERRRRRRARAATPERADGFRLSLNVVGVGVALLGVTVVPAIASYVAMTRITVALESRSGSVEANIAEMKRVVDVLAAQNTTQAVAQERIATQMDAVVERINKTETGVRALADHLLDRADLEPVEPPPPPARRRR